MTIFRWVGAAALVPSVGCNGTVANAPDGSAGAADGSARGDATSSSDANLGDAGSPDAGDACTTSAVTFLLTAAPGNITGYCLGAPGTCSNQWLAIRPANGGSLAVDTSCQTQCGTCQLSACPPGPCAASLPLGDGGAQSTWDGTYYAPGTCGSGTACVNQACAPPGNYIATFCGYAELPDASAFGCNGASTSTCVETPFVWPPPAGSSPVHGVLANSP